MGARGCGGAPASPAKTKTEGEKQVNSNQSHGKGRGLVTEFMHCTGSVQKAIRKAIEGAGEEPQCHHS